MHIGTLVWSSRGRFKSESIEPMEWFSITLWSHRRPRFFGRSRWWPGGGIVDRDGEWPVDADRWSVVRRPVTIPSVSPCRGSTHLPISSASIIFFSLLQFYSRRPGVPESGRLLLRTVFWTRRSVRSRNPYSNVRWRPFHNRPRRTSQRSPAPPFVTNRNRARIFYSPRFVTVAFIAFIPFSCARSLWFLCSEVIEFDAVEHGALRQFFVEIPSLYLLEWSDFTLMNML